MSPPAGKSVDWLDAHNALGVDVVRERLDEAAFMATTAEEEAARAAAGAEGGRPGAAPTGGRPEDLADWVERIDPDIGMDRDYYPIDHADAAIIALDELFAPDDRRRATGATWRLVTWNGQYYVWRDGRWSVMSHGVMRSMLRTWARTKLVRKRVLDEDNSTNGEKVFKYVDFDYVPTNKSLGELLSAIEDLTCIETDGMGKWLARAYFDDGVPGYRVHAPSRVLDDEARAAEGLPDPAKLLVMQNGYMHTDDIAAGRAELTPPTERLFAADPIPHPWPESATEAIRAGTVDAWYQEHCPGWLDNLEWIDAGRERFSSILIRHFGRAMIGDFSSEQIPLLQGGPGSAKSTTIAPVVEVFGDAAIRGMTLDALGDESQMPHLIGKRLVVFPDAEVSGKASVLAIGETLKKMAEGNVLHARVLFKGAHEFACTSLPVIVCNRIPNLRDPGGALSKRFAGFMFRRGIRGTAQMDTSIKSRIIAEAPSIMVHLVWEGLRPYLEDKAAGVNPLPMPDDHDQIMQLFDEQADTIGQFVDDVLEPCMAKGVPGVPEGEEPSIHIGTLYEIAKVWATQREKQDQLHSKSMFAQNLQAAVVGFGCYHKNKVLRDEVGQKLGRPSHWFGLRLRPGVLAELFPTGTEEGLPTYGVHPKSDLDWQAHRRVVEEIYTDGEDETAASPPPYSGLIAPEQGVSDA